MRLAEAIQLEGLENDQQQRLEATRAIETLYGHISDFGLYGFYGERSNRFNSSLISIKSKDIFNYQGIPFTFSFYGAGDKLQRNLGLYYSNEKRVAVKILSDFAYIDCIDAIADNKSISQDTLQELHKTKKTAFHEYIHLLDDVKGGWTGNVTRGSSKMDYYNHSNSDIEVNTRMQEAIYQFENQVRDVKRRYHDALQRAYRQSSDPEIVEVLMMGEIAYERKNDIEDLTHSFDDWFRFIKRLNPSFWNVLEYQRERNLINRLYQYWDNNVKGRTIDTIQTSETYY